LPTNPYFTNTGLDYAHDQISIDIFVFTHGKDQFKNMATLMELSKRSSGSVYYYPEFNANAQGMKFTNELYNALSRS
jgi:hypothetical protein